MDEILYNSLTRYYTALEKLGYYPYKEVFRLLVLCFYRDFVYHDFRANLSCEDYHQIELALDCLFGSTCLIPYPDYLKMGKLHIGDITELSSRIKNIEDLDVTQIVEDLDELRKGTSHLVTVDPNETPE